MTADLDAARARRDDYADERWIANSPRTAALFTDLIEEVEALRAAAQKPRGAKTITLSRAEYNALREMSLRYDAEFEDPLAYGVARARKVSARVEEILKRWRDA